MAEQHLKAKLSKAIRGGDVLHDKYDYHYLKNKTVGNKTFCKCREKLAEKCSSHDIKEYLFSLQEDA